MDSELIYNCCKRMLDICAALLAIVLLSPVFVIIAILIRLQSKGPAVFTQERAGKNAKPFTLYKFRTMRTGINPFGASPKSEDDPRLTSVGRFLREYSLDELPQFFNVLKGEMSLVGPRPLYVAQIAEWNDEQKRRLLVKPGITGLAQISGRGGLTREKKLQLDVQYVNSRRWWEDIRIILATCLHVVGRKSIYEKKYSETEHTRDSGEEEKGPDRQEDPR